jgi:hypothetical protein
MAQGSTSPCQVNVSITTGNTTTPTLANLDLCTVEGIPYLLEDGVTHSGAAIPPGVALAADMLPNNTCRVGNDR